MKVPAAMTSPETLDVMPQPRVAETNGLAVGVVLAAGVVAALQVGKVAIAMPALNADLGLDLAQAGWVMAVYALLGAIGGIPTGAIVNRFGDRRLLVLGLLAIAAGSGAGAAVETYATLLGARMVEGLGFLLITIAAPALLQDLVAPADHDRAFGLWGAFMPTGMALALLAGPMLEGWRGFWLVNAGLALVVASFVMVLVSRRPHQREPLSWRTMGRDATATIRAGGPAILAAAFVIYSLQYIALFTFLPVLLVERMQVSLANAGQLSAVAVAANIAGNVASGLLLGRGVPRWAIVAVTSAVMSLAALGIFLPGLSDALVFALCVAFSGVGGLIPATLLGAAPLAAPSVRLEPISIGFVTQGANLGQLVGAAAVGGAVSALGWPGAALLVTGTGVVGVLLAITLFRYSGQLQQRD